MIKSNIAITKLDVGFVLTMEGVTSAVEGSESLMNKILKHADEIISSIYNDGNVKTMEIELSVHENPPTKAS